MYCKRKVASKLVAFFVAAVTVIAFAFSGVNGVSAVNAGGRTGDYGIRESYDDSDRQFPEAVFTDEYFDANGNITLEYKPMDNSEYTLIYQDETNKKVYINSNYYEFHNEYLHAAYFVINKEKLVKCDGSSLVLNKSDFKKNGNLATYYGENYGDVTIGIIGANVKDQWYQGFWFDANGENTYAPRGSWKGSGDWQWYEDTSGWYPVNCWQRMDKLYENYTGNGNPATVATESRSWGQGKMYVSKGWFYFDENGYAATNGWYKIDGSWYYFDNFLYEGGCWRDGYYIGYDGVQSYPYTGSWKSNSTGWWFEDTSGWYPCNEKVVINGNEYYFKSNGYLAVDEWIEPGEAGNTWTGMWIHVDSSGLEDKTGSYDENGNWTETPN
ncbi:Glucan-binding domain-containing protein (YG repeat) [Lachnospiraceae bacterium NE2001]|nr:Glucan-binding domain-containing protein (YG repeat) [Lachnospiraceae bacterium NE2001]